MPRGSGYGGGGGATARGAHPSSARLNSSRGLVMRHGELVAISHAAPKRGGTAGAGGNILAQTNSMGVGKTMQTSYRSDHCMQQRQFDPNRCVE
jgi:hypothetical protein